MSINLGKDIDKDIMGMTPGGTDSVDNAVGADKKKTHIMVIGVGGGGGNAVKHMYRNGAIDCVRYVACNTDSQALETSGIPIKLLLGPTVTRGGGAGNKPEVARLAAEESAEDIRALLQTEPKPQMVFITAGMGGGTGTGAAPVVARIAKELEILTVGIVTIPFIFEGAPKILKAHEYIKKLREEVDALLVINNERLRDIYPDMTFLNAFAMADDILSMAAGSIIEIILKTGPVNCDFNDVKTTLAKGGTAIISTGIGRGEMRVAQAIENAIKSPLLQDSDIFSSQTLLQIIFLSPGDSQMKLHETEQLNDFATKFARNPDTITGVYIDDSLNDEVRVTILAAGFKSKEDIEKEKEAAERVTRQKKEDENEDNTEKKDEILKIWYGEDRMRDMQRKQLQIAVLTRSDMENEALLDVFDNIPTYDRSPDFRQKLSEAGVARNNEEQPSVTNENNIKTINFGD